MLNLVNLLYSFNEKWDFQSGKLLKKEEIPPREHSDSHHPSRTAALVPKFDPVKKKDVLVHAGACRRQLFYDMSHEIKTDPITAVSLLKMEMGNRFHEMFSDMLDVLVGELGGTVKREIAFKWKDPKLKKPWSGRLDLIIELDGVKYGVEFKTKYGYGINAIKRGDVSETELFQTLIYLEQQVEPISGIFLLFIAKDSGYLYGFYISKKKGDILLHFMNSDTFGSIVYRYEHILAAHVQLEKMLKAGKVPERDFEAKVKDGKIVKGGDWQCSYCSFAKLCYGLTEAPNADSDS